MWGYIAVYLDPWRLGRVPSLYVRVYRLYKRQGKTGICSLIICEGISYKNGAILEAVGFPHYMWGYIVHTYIWHITKNVPSLYVRVYPPGSLGARPALGSLIICEGISPAGQPGAIRAVFPHYMWGYIGLFTLLFFALFVPSLYVRIYRPGHRLRRV